MSSIDYANSTDEELASSAVEDNLAFAEIVRRYQGKLMSYIRRISNVSNEEAEDLLQDSFLKAYKNLNDFDSNLKLSSWLYRITHNQVISEYRKKNARAHGHCVELDEVLIERLASDLDTAKEVDIALLKKNIDTILNKIDGKYREVLVLRFFEEQSYQEISDVLQKPLGTIATLVNRAKVQFVKEAKLLGIEF
jgi:RNA polymerase sigma-70 factor (ECF subfamily)